MKQTIAILTALMLALLLVSGFVAAGSLQQSHLLTASDAELTQLSDALAKQLAENEKLTREAQRSAAQLAEVIQERDALSAQLGDAVLSSQEANDAVAQQALAVEEQAQTIRRLQAENRALQDRLAAVEAMAQPTAAPSSVPTRTPLSPDRIR